MISFVILNLFFPFTVLLDAVVLVVVDRVRLPINRPVLLLLALVPPAPKLPPCEPLPEGIGSCSYKDVSWKSSDGLVWCLPPLASKDLGASDALLKSSALSLGSVGPETDAFVGEDPPSCPWFCG